MSNRLHRTSGGLLRLTVPEHADRPNSRRRATGRRITESAPPAIPHGEGLFRNNPDPEDTLPRPRCAECSGPIFYEDGIWWHAELANDHHHAAEPEIALLTGHRDHERIVP